MMRRGLYELNELNELAGASFVSFVSFVTLERTFVSPHSPLAGQPTPLSSDGFPHLPADYEGSRKSTRPAQARIRERA